MSLIAVYYTINRRAARPDRPLLLQLEDAGLASRNRDGEAVPLQRDLFAGVSDQELATSAASAVTPMQFIAARTDRPAQLSRRTAWHR